MDGIVDVGGVVGRSAAYALAREEPPSSTPGSCPIGPAMTTTGPELHSTTGPRCSVAGLDLHLDRAGGRARDSVMDAVRDAIRSGRLAPGTRLPSSRALAADLGVARNTVARAYAELITEGWLTSQHGSSTLVSQRAAEIVRVRRRATYATSAAPARPRLAAWAS